MRTLRTLVGALVFALASGFPVADISVVQTVQAEEEEQPAEESESESTAEEEQDGKDSDSKDSAGQEDAADSSTDESSNEEPADSEPAETETEEAPTEKPRSKKPTNDKPADEQAASKKNSEQEKAEEAVGDEVSDAEKAAAEEEDAKAAEAEAAGAEVEVDESDEIEEEPEDSEKSPNRPGVNGDEPVKQTPSSEKRVIGATATIMEKQSELLFRARVDSGAKSCSLHIEDYKIENESDSLAENIGKVITFHIKNGNGESHWLSAKIASYVVVKNAAGRGRRYKVPLTLRFKDFEKTVLVTLNNREKMEYPLLLGRNFLIGDFIIDVEVDNNELHTR